MLISASMVSTFTGMDGFTSSTKNSVRSVSAGRIPTSKVHLVPSRLPSAQSQPGVLPAVWKTVFGGTVCWIFTPMAS